MIMFLNKPQFSESPFNSFFIIKNKLSKQIGKYEYYHDIWNLVNASIKSSNSFQLIAEIEHKYQNETVQQFYQEINAILETTYDENIVSRTILDKFNTTYHHLEDYTMRKAITNYQQECQKISLYGEWGLRVFRRHQQTQFLHVDACVSLHNLVSTLSENIKQIDKKNRVLEIINNNYTIFSQLNSLLTIKDTEQNHDFYYRMLQYLVLENKYGTNYQEFKKFLASLYKWGKHYQVILDIRNKYPIAEYKQPASFLKEIQGEEIFLKHKSYLKNLLETK